MRIRVHYTDGHEEEFDTAALTSTSPLGKGNVMSDLALAVREDGLWVEASWYGIAGSTQDSLARRSPGCSIHLLSAEELACAETIFTSDVALFRRVGPDLMDMCRFEQAMALFFEPDEVVRDSISSRAELLHSLLKQRFPEKPEDELLAMMGLTKASYQFMSGADVSVDSGKVFIEEG